MASLDLTFLGGFRACSAVGEDFVLPGRKGQLLLAYLALHAGEAQTREKVIGLLWSDRGDAQARGSLRQELMTLRKALGKAERSPIVIDGERLWLDAAVVGVDVRRFEELVLSDETAAIEAAVELYRGPFLDGLIVRDPACEEWLAQERERLRLLLLGALDRLLERRMKAGELARATTIAETILVHDPLREDAHRALMLLYAAQDRRSLALRQYQICRDTLARELGVEPEPETDRVYDDIQTQRASAPHRRTAAGGATAALAAPPEASSRTASAVSTSAISRADMEAYQFYLMGRSFFLRNVWGKGALDAARQLFLQAIEIDPRYARAYAGLANCDCYRLLLGVPEASFDTIAANSARALELEPELAEAHATKGLALYTVGQHVAADEAFEQAVKLGPELFEAHYFYARNCRTQGLHAKAAELFERAAALNQNDFRALGLLVDEYRALGRLEDSLSAARRCLEKINVEVAAQPDDGYALAFGSNVLAELGERERAEEWAARAYRIDPDDAIVNYNLACAYAQLRRPDAALDRLRATFGAVPINRRAFLEWMQHDTALDPVREYVDFRALVEQLEADGAISAPERTDALRTARIPHDRPAIAVLPFDGQSGDSEQEYLADGIVDEITAALSRVRSFLVIARSSTQRYRGSAGDAAQIGRELGVRYLLRGSVRAAAGRVRISVQLFEAAFGSCIWADRYEGRREEVFDFEDRIAERTVGAIEPTIRWAEIERARRKRPDNLEAYDYVMRALPHVWALTPEDCAEALRLTTEAVCLDPGHARANALAAWCHAFQFANGWAPSPAQSRAEGQRLAQAALRHGGDDPDVLIQAAACAMMLTGDLEAAALHIGKALALDPNSAWGWIRSGYLHVWRGEPETALTHFERAARLNPFDPLDFNRCIGIALAHFVAGRYGDAVEWARKGRLERPGLPWAYRVLAAAHARLGQDEEARAAARIALGQCAHLSVPVIMETAPFRQAEVRELFEDGLRRAGIPDVAAPLDANEPHKLVADLPESAPAPAAADRPALAVLPFENLSGDPEQQYFSDGITEDIITELSCWRQLTVLSRNSSFRYRGTAVDMKRVGRELGVGYVVEGSVRKVGDRIRVTAQLVDAVSGHHLWAERYDREAQEIFAVQGDVAQTIVGTLVGRVQAAGAEMAKRKPPASLAAYDCVLRAQALPWGDPQADAEARRLYEKAIELDPGYGLAHALLALMLYAEWGADMTGSDATLDRAFELATKAVELDGSESMCQAVLGLVHLMRKSFDLAEQYHRRAVEMNPSNPQHLADMGSLLVYLGKPEKGLEWLERARRVDPYFGPAWYWHQVGFACMTARRYDDAIKAFQRSTTMPYWARAYIAACHAQLGRMSEAGEWATEALRLRPDFSTTGNASKEPFRHRRDLDHLLDSLRKAGIPESSPPSAASARGKEPARSAPAAELRPALAVLPFDNIGGDEEYFSDGLSEDLITALTLWRSFPVIARNSTFAYKGRSVDIKQVARELGARYLVEGSVRKAGDRVRVAVQLVDGTTGHHVWANRYDREIGDIFALQDELTQRIAAVVAPEIERAEVKRAVMKRPGDLDAWDCYLRGMSLLAQFTPEGNARSRTMFERAVALDPDYADGYTGLAVSHNRDVLLQCTTDRDRSLDSAMQAARRAVALDPSSATAHSALGTVHIWRDENDLALAEARLALDLNPNDAVNLHALGNKLDLAGDPEGIAHMVRAQQLNPLDPDRHSHLCFLARAYVNARRYEEAVGGARAAIQRQPDYPHAHFILAIALGHLGRCAEAHAALVRSDKLHPGFVAARADWSPYRDHAANRHLQDGLMKAGLAPAPAVNPLYRAGQSAE